MPKQSTSSRSPLEPETLRRYAWKAMLGRGLLLLRAETITTPQRGGIHCSSYIRRSPFEAKSWALCAQV